MKKDDPNARLEGRENTDGPGRDDTNRNLSDPLAKFSKDKRKRITRIEKNPGKFEAQGEDAPSRYQREERRYPGTQDERPQRPYGQSGERRSYNPNFTPDNKLRSGNTSFRKDTRSYVDTSKDDYFNSTDYNRSDRDNRRPSDRNERGGYNKSQGGYGQKPSYSGGGRSTGYGGSDRSSDRSSGYSRDNRDSRDNRGYGDRQGSRDGGRTSGYGGDNRQGSRDTGRDNRGGSYGGRTSGPDNRGASYGGRSTGQDNRGYSPRGQQSGGYAGKGGFQKRSGQDPRRSQPAFDKDNYPKYPRGAQPEEVRLNRFISMSGICSRREADELIASGLVTVNGVVVTEMGSKVHPGDVVCHDGVVVKGESKVYIVMNKPKGFVTSLDDPHAEKTVMDILKNSVKERVYPVGRLDKNSTGVLLITNDGDMTTKLTHPSYEKKKIYQVTLDKSLAPADRDKIAQGITLEDGFIKADNVDYVKDDPKVIGVEIHSGRNRVVRRIFEHLGYQVRKLDRVYFAGLTKKNLKRGAWRFLTPREVSALYSGQYE